MIPVQFDYATAHSLEEAVRYLQTHPNARVLAGGTDLLPSLSRRRIAPAALVDLQHIPGLATIERLDSGGMRIGALAPLVTIAEQRDVKASYPALMEAIAAVGDPQIRNRGTLGGNLAQSNANGDPAAALLAIGATVTIAGPSGDRAVSVDALLAESGQVRLDPAEIITSVDLPGDAAGSAYEKVRNPASDYAICGVAALVRLAADGTVRQCRIAVTGATTAVTRLASLEATLIGQASSSVTPGSDALQAQLVSLAFADDWVASAEYRAHLTRVLTLRSIQRAVERARRRGSN